MATPSDKKYNPRKAKGSKAQTSTHRGFTTNYHNNTNNSNHNNRRPIFSRRPDSVPAKLTSLATEINILGQDILILIIDSLNRTEIENSESLMCDRFRVGTTRHIREGLKSSRRKEVRQRQLMKQLLDLRSTLPNSALVKFYENKEILAKQNQELKSFMALCEAKIRLIRIFNNLGDRILEFKKENELQSLDFKDALPQLLDRNLNDLQVNIEPDDDTKQTVVDAHKAELEIEDATSGNEKSETD